MTTLTVPERSPWRWPAAAAGLVVVASHIPVTPMHLSEAPYIGWSFVALEIAMAVLAAALLLEDTPLVWAAAGVVPALAIAAYALTRSVALPQIADDVGNWTEPLGVVAVVAEALLVVLVIGRHSWRRSWLARWPLGFAAVLLAMGVLATGCAASAGVG
jgi:hypothetical protein